MTMNTSRIGLLALLLLVVMVGQRVFQHTPPAPTPKPDSASNTAQPASGVSNTVRQPRLAEEWDVARSNSWAAHQRDGSWRSEPKVQEALDGERQDRSWKWKRPIRFYGLVWDDQDQPVADAEVRFQWTDTSPEGTREMLLQSNASGEVELVDRQGYVLTIHASKEGYDTTQQGTFSLNYAEPWDRRFHQPDPTRPVILRLRKRGTSEPLVHRQGLRFPITPNPGTVMIDLVGQRRTTVGGDLVFRLEHGPEVFIDGKRRFDWNVEVLGVDGGLLEHQLEFPVLAPEGGYLPRLQRSMKASDPGWSDHWTVSCFFQSQKGGHYGRVTFQAFPFPQGSSPGVTLLEYFVNPVGSRNLQYSRDMDVSERYYLPHEN